MKKWLIVVFTSFVLVGCSGNDVTKTKEPPTLTVKASAINEEAIVGTYCWNSKCLDKDGASKLVEEEEPLKVKAGEKITLKQKEELRPNKYYLTEINGETDKEKELQSTDYTFNAPTESGIYIYGFTGTWYGENTNEIANTVQYAFKLQVQ